MRDDPLVAAVQRAAAIDTAEHAVDAVLATVQVLGRRVEGACAVLAAHLPAEMCAHLFPGGATTPFALERFYDLVAAVEGRGCSSHLARRHARTIVTALRGRVGAPLDVVLLGLPLAYADLLSASVQDDRPALAQGPARTPGAPAADGPPTGPRVPGQRSPGHDSFPA